MKNKHSKHYLTAHQRIERFFRHRVFLMVVLASMGIGLLKYQSNLLGAMQQLYYGNGLSFLHANASHEEITRMPVNYGTSKLPTISSN